MNRAAAAAAAGSGMGYRPLFTASQWQELEHQALIFKYLNAGIPVPPELLVPIRRSYESMAASFYSRPSLSHCSFYGKKVDPEPGRCRRTDGKKWRCSKDAHQDSKYCERHMHRGRSRSRKHVETSPAVPLPHSSSSTETSFAPSSAGKSRATAATAGGGSIPGLAFRSMGAAALSAPSQVRINPASYGMSAIGAATDLRCLPESRPELDKCSFLSEASGSSRTPSMSPSFDSSWRPTPYSPPISSFPPLARVTNRLLQLQPAQSSLYRHPHISSLEQPGRSVQPLLPFFDEWPGMRYAWPDLEDESAATRLSISVPATSPDFSTTTSLSQNDD